MEKKKVGQGFKSLFDELDGKIILALFKNPRGVLELTRALNVGYKTIKKHLDKLGSYELIMFKRQSQNKKLLLLPPPLVQFLVNQDNLMSYGDIDKSFKIVSKQLFKMPDELRKEMEEQTIKIKKQIKDKFLK